MNTTTALPSVRMQPPDPATIVACAWHYWWLALILGVLFAGMGAFAGYLVIPAKFHASALIRIAGASWVVDRRTESSTDTRQFRKTQVELLQMPHVLRRALEAPQVKELGVLGTDPESIEELRDILKADLPNNSEILRISVEHDRADVAFYLANAVTESYLLEIGRDSEELLAKRLGVLEKLHKASEDRLAKAWAEFKAMARQLGASDLGALSLQAQAEIANYRDSNQRLQELRAEKREAERIIRSLRESPETFAAEIPNEDQISIRYALFQVKLRKEQELAKWGENHPNVLAAQRNEDIFLEFYQKGLMEQEEEQRRSKSREEEILAEPMATLARLGTEELALESIMREIDERMQLLGGENIAKLEVIRNDIRRMERLSDRIWEARENLQVECHADDRVQLVTLASLPDRRDTSKRNKVSLVLVAGAFGFAVLLVAMGEFLTGRLHSGREATQRTGLAVLASLPRLPEKVLDFKPEDSSEKKNRLRSHLDMLVAQIRHDPQADAPRTILVTSPRRARERERLTVHLAAALARTGHRTVIVDFDLRGRPVCVVFPNADGGGSEGPQHVLADSSMVAGRPDLSPIEANGDREDPTRPPFPAKMPLIGTGVANLDLLRPTRVSAEPLPVFAHPELPTLLETLKQLYTYVVIEVPEVLEYPDAMHLGRLADVLILSLQRNRSVAGDVVQAQAELAQHGRPVFGAMID